MHHFLLSSAFHLSDRNTTNFIFNLNLLMVNLQNLIHIFLFREKYVAEFILKIQIQLKNHFQLY
jgi:hypothetical protein